jgi:hypothetical protein
LPLSLDIKSPYVIDSGQDSEARAGRLPAHLMFATIALFVAPLRWVNEHRPRSRKPTYMTVDLREVWSVWMD